MQLVEIALFAAVAALALTLIGYAVRPYLRARRRPTAGKHSPSSPRRRGSSRRVPRRWSALPATATTRQGCASAPTTRAIWFWPAIRRRGPPAPAPPARPAGAPTTPGRSSARSTARSWFRCRWRWVRAIRPPRWPSLRGRAGKDLPQLLAPLRERGDLLRPRRRRAGPRQLVRPPSRDRLGGIGHARVAAAPARLLACVLASSTGVV